MLNTIDKILIKTIEEVLNKSKAIFLKKPKLQISVFFVTYQHFLSTKLT